jgi:hypothetical protein
MPVSIGHSELSRHRTDGRWWNEFKDFLRSRGIPIAQDSDVIGLDNFGLDMDIRSEMLNPDIQFIQNSSEAYP